MVFDDGTRQSVSHLVSRMSSAHQRFYSPCFINATEQLASGQPENASDAAVKGNRISHGNQSPAPLVAMTKPLTFAKPQHSTLFWDIDMQLYSSIAKPRTFSIESKWMFAEKSAQQCLFLKAFGCDGVMVNQVALLTHGQNIGTGKPTSAFTISYPMR